MQLLNILMSLCKINKDDLIFSHDIEDSCTNTQLTLDDYDWMTYKLNTKFRTKKMGILYVEFEYCGFADSFMSIEQITPENKDVKYSFVFSSELFKQHLVKFMRNYYDTIRRSVAEKDLHNELSDTLITKIFF